jgi:hypothetical protein
VWCRCHTKEPDTERYTTFAYTFEAEPPFAIMSWSRPLLLQGRIQMAMSISVIGITDGGEGSAGQAGEGPADKGTMLVGYGSEDKVRPLRPARVCSEILYVCVCVCVCVRACVRACACECNSYVCQFQEMHQEPEPAALALRS